MKNLPLLIELICETYDQTEYRPRDGVTYCNFAAADIAGGMGCREFANKLANEIIDTIQRSPDWEERRMGEVQALANQGSLVFAAQKDYPHGHLCVVRPGIEEPSPRWGTNAPAVMNIGKTNFIGKGVNWAFQRPPQFYVWKKSL